MPLKPEVKHLYRGPKWEVTRRLVLARARHCCEWCKKPNFLEVVTAPGGLWRLRESTEWRGPDGQPTKPPPPSQERKRQTVLQLAHLNRKAGDDRLENLAALCAACHLRHDAEQHRLNAKATRRAKKRNQELFP